MVICALVVAISLGDREPSYKGKRLSEWVEIYEHDAEGEARSADTPACRAAVEAVRHMSDKVLPRALKLIRYEKPNWKNEVERAMEHRLDVRSWCPVWIWHPFYGEPSNEGLVYFQMLGPEASAAVPELVRTINKGKAPRFLAPVSDRAMYALSCIGKEGLPPLMEMLADPRSPYRRRAVYAIKDMNHQPEVALPALPLLIESLNDTDSEVASAAAMALGNLAMVADTSVRALAGSLQNPDDYVRRCAAESLEKFRENARAAMPALLNALRDPDDAVRRAVTNALEQIAPDILEKSR